MRDGPNRVFTDPFGVLNPSLSPGEAAYNTTVRLLTTEYGYNDYDALNLSVEKRYSNNYSLRFGYSLSESRGIAAGQGDTPQLQVGTDLNLDEYDGTGRHQSPHNANMSGRMEIPKTGAHLQRHDPNDDRRAFHDSGRHARPGHEPHQLPAAAGRHLQSRPAGGRARDDAMSRTKAAATARSAPASCSSTCASAIVPDWADAGRSNFR